MRYVLIATIIGWGGGATNYPLWYGVPVPPAFNIFVSVYIIIVAYAIVKHQLLEIEVVIKKTLVFASLFVIIFGIFVGVTLLTQELIAGGRLLGLAISSIIIILAVRPLEDFLVRATDKYLFQKKYDYKHLIRQFMDDLKTMVLNTNDIAQSTLDFLESSIRPASSAIFMYNKFTNEYDVIVATDFKDSNFKLSDNAKLITELKNNAQIVNLNHKLNPSNPEKSQLLSLGVELLIPLIIHKDLLGILALGKKKSDEAYTEEDVDALSDLSGALSIAVNNAQLFDERADAEKRAMIGTLATGINHEIGNPLNIISIKLQSFRLLAQQGLLEKKSKEDIIDEINNIAGACLDSTRRIADITKKISEFAKPNKQLALDEVNVGEVIDGTISILGHELSLERIKFEKDIRCKSPHAIADRGQLQQIIFNLVKNAAQAIEKGDLENGKIIIRVDTHNRDEIIIKVVDNGPGIPKKDLDKIFMPFYTTKEPGKGTGLGLALVSRLVERNSGKMEVDSNEGKGTVFTLIFKGKCYG
jgi:signal transduction histidine kinase